MNRKPLMAVTLGVALLLTGCSTASGETPFFTTSGGSASTSDETPSASANGSSDAGSSENGSNSQTSDELPSPTFSGTPGQTDFSKEYAEANGLKLDENGNPYDPGSESDNSKPDADMTDPDYILEPPKPGDTVEPDFRSASKEDTSTAVASFTNIIEAAENEDWEKACGYVALEYLVTSMDDCVSNIPDIYGPDMMNKDDLLTKENAAAKMLDKDSIEVWNEENNVYISSRQLFVREGGTWKMVLPV